MKRLIAMICALILGALCLTSCGNGNGSGNTVPTTPPEERYAKALECLEDGDYKQAHRLFYGLRDYKDSKEYLGRFAIVCQTASVKMGQPILMKLGIGEAYTIRTPYDEHGNLLSEDKGMTVVGGGMKITKGYRVYEYEYDDSGRIVTCSITTQGKGTNKTNKTKTFVYGANGKLAKESELDEAGNVCYYHEWVYDKDGNLIREIGLAGDEQRVLRENSYDENGLLVKEIEYDEEGGIERAYEYKYDENGLLVKKIEYDEEGGIERVYEYKYDENNRLIQKSMRYDEDITITDYEYDENGELITEPEFEEEYENVKYEYDPETGLPISRTTRSGDGYGYTVDEFYPTGIIMKSTWYSEDGEATRVRLYDEYGKQTESTDRRDTTSYQYDKNGNLTRTYYETEGRIVIMTYSDFVYYYYPDGLPEVRMTSYPDLGGNRWFQYNLGWENPLNAD